MLLALASTQLQRHESLSDLLASSALTTPPESLRRPDVSERELAAFWNNRAARQAFYGLDTMSSICAVAPLDGLKEHFDIQLHAPRHWHPACCGLPFNSSATSPAASNRAGPSSCMAGSNASCFRSNPRAPICQRPCAHRALVFSQFTDFLAIVRQALDQRGLKYQYLDGQTAPKARQQAVDAFQAGQGELFLLSLKAGGVGLNLIAADYVIHLDPWWNPAIEQLATDRAHRIGQTRPVTVYKLVLAGSIEEQTPALHGSKRELVDAMLAEQDGGSRLGLEDLLGLLRGVES